MADDEAARNKIKKNDPLTGEPTEILAAAQQLMQLSDQDNNDNSGSSDDFKDIDEVTGKRKKISNSDEIKTSSKLIKEIFGNEVDHHHHHHVVTAPSKKNLKKYYGSRVDKYKVTTPIDGQDDVNDVAGGERNRSSDEEEGVEVDIIDSAKKIKAVIGRPKKPRKYRSLVNIYRVTTPIN